MTSGSFKVTRNVTVRVTGPVDQTTSEQLHRIVTDIIDDHGISDLVIDFSQATSLVDGVKDTLDWAQDRLIEANGLLELRLPEAPTNAWVELSTDIPSFVPLEE